jgi:PadR family transcriptional regulator, regulatory protein AphA
MPTRTTTTLTATEAAILGLLGRGPRSGYDLKKAVEGSVGYFWSPAKSQIYAVLPRLVDAGLASVRRVRQEQRPDKQVYRITARGREALRAWLDTPLGAPEPDRNPLLLKLFFGAEADPHALLEHVRARREEAEQLKAELVAIDRAPRKGDDFFPRLTRRYGHRYADAIIRWARETERDLQARLEA